MKSTKCKNCGYDSHDHFDKWRDKPLKCKKFEPQCDNVVKETGGLCGRAFDESDTNSYCFEHRGKPEPQEVFQKEADPDVLINKPKNHSHPDESLMNPKTSYPGSDNSPREELAYPVIKSAEKSDSLSTPEDTLSSKIYISYNDGRILDKQDIKEFIQKLKEAQKDSSCEHISCFGICYDWLNGSWIDKLAGKELLEW